MKKLRVFISSVQTEFASERKLLWEYLTTDALFGQFFETFIFENLPASDQKAEKVYLNEVGKCDIYLGILGKEYGYEDKDGVSPTEREFDEAVRLSKTKLLFLTNHKKEDRHLNEV
ncbi:MAG: DUF4062 domain-containing protein, partial [Ignavibacteria bacterium]|nr:DUF4062 domain-containing protein [Ignavibacteria bacterium]